MIFEKRKIIYHELINVGLGNLTLEDDFFGQG